MSVTQPAWRIAAVQVVAEIQECCNGCCFTFESMLTINMQEWKEDDGLLWTVEAV